MHMLLHNVIANRGRLYLILIVASRSRDTPNLINRVGDIATLHIHLSLKTVQLSPPIFGKFCEKLILCFSPKYIGLPVLTKYIFLKQLCPEEGRNFCYSNLTLGHFYTFNTWNSHKKIFSQSCRYGKYLSFATFVTPITVLRAEQFAFPCNVFFFAELQLKKFWAWAETKTGLCWGSLTAKAFDEFQTNLIFNRGT